ncbi:MAG: hypothetical protein H5U18_01230 [Rhodobacteraceae bacterium]|nr:hypothetical protein [Paracoccaceae bacterium]
MRQIRTPHTPAVHGIHAPAARLTFSAAMLVAMGLSAAFLVVLAGFTAAMTMIWPG